MNNQVKQHRFKLIHTISGQTVARADNLTDLRNMVDRANANYFTLHDLQEGSFAGASIIFNEEPSLSTVDSERTYTTK